MKKVKDNEIRPVLQPKLERVEYFRSAMALLPEDKDKNPGVAYLQVDESNKYEKRFCTCNSSQRTTCKHIKELMSIYKGMIHVHGKNRFDENFQSSLWYQLFKILVDNNKCTPNMVFSHTKTNKHGKYISIITEKKDHLIFYYSVNSDRSRFIERCTANSNGNNGISRHDVYKALKSLVLTKNEQEMLTKGYKTRRMAQEESFWYYFTYHCFREFENKEYIVKTDIKDKTCEYLFICMDKEQNPVFEIPLPTESIKAINERIVKPFSIEQPIPTHPIPIQPVLNIRLKKNKIEVSTVYRFLDIDNTVTYFQKESLLPFQYGNIFHIKEKNILVEVLASEGAVNDFIENDINIIPEDNIPEFLITYGQELKEGHHLLDPDIKKLKIIKTFDKVIINPKAIDSDWCWLSADYGLGDSSVSLKDILAARNKNERFIKTENGWIYTYSPLIDVFQPLLDMPHVKQSLIKNEEIKLSRFDLLKLRAVSDINPIVKGDDKTAIQIKNIIEMKPLSKTIAYKGMTSKLRGYQITGVDWIRYLYENRFGGLLCDDMGLGKTHQIMAFMLYLKTRQAVSDPFLVICPTSVLSHWKNKIKEHIPGLTAAVYHGGNRDFNTDITNSDIIITTYGILWRDIKEISNIEFHIAVFDEAQFIKNSDTKMYKAAKQIKANMKLGVSGTPIENSLSELKSLMDIVNPGYLGTDLGFKGRYIKPIETEADGMRKKELNRIIFPFTLRRLKKSVLNELPDKIENFYTCRLHEDQIKLYQEAIASRGAGLLKTLFDDKKSVPYIHIFALLTLLKQICDHPALTIKSIEDYKKYNSGKWDIFKELLHLCLDNNQKIVIYSQFLGMIRIMEHYLNENKIQYVSLTGASKNRGKIIKTFNEDSDCRVFIGSLKAGGVGIDLVAASLVIHYDRWWNAAKEDQATDRVHRIGQKKGVQVFKLITKGTLEEKISAIIDKKRHLMDSVVKEDDPNVLKTFTRQELVDILSIPTS